MIAILVTISIYASYGYIYYAIGSSLTRALAAREAVKKEQIYKDQKQNLMDMYKQTINDRAELSTFFVADDQKVSFIEAIESFGNSTGAKVVLSGIVADDLATNKPGTLGKVSLHVDATGSWASVMRVLKLAETLPYKTSVGGVRVDYSGTSDSKDPAKIWRISFVLDTASIRRTL